MNRIEVSGVSKRYALGEGSGGYQTLREALVRAVRPRPDRRSAELWALRDVSLTIIEGEVVGLVGRNGAGKTTLLKILARITQPTCGVSRTRGRVGTLLEVGTGFHPELTGRENIHLYGAVLGMARRDIDRQFDEIVTFAGVEAFLDTPLKRYSSGMYLRLAFAVAAHLAADIMIVDEVLAVGDAEFQRRCIGRMSEFGREGHTTVFVSHDLGAIARLCTRTVWLDGGVIKADGRTDVVLERYRQQPISDESNAILTGGLGGPVQLSSVAVVDLNGAAMSTLRRGVAFVFKLTFAVREPIRGLNLCLYLTNQHGIRVIDDAWADRCSAAGGADQPGEYEAHVTIPPILTAGAYQLGIWIGTEFEMLLRNEAFVFSVSPRLEDRREAVERRRAVQPELEWRVAPVAPHTSRANTLNQ